MRFARNKEEKKHETICHCGGWACRLRKSTVAKLVAKRLGIIYVDTGAMYRTVALFCTEKGLPLRMKQAVVGRRWQICR